MKVKRIEVMAEVFWPTATMVMTAVEMALSFNNGTLAGRVIGDHAVMGRLTAVRSFAGSAALPSREMFKIVQDVRHL